MPILIRETTIRANLTGDAEAPKNNPNPAPASTEPGAEEQVQKILLRKLKAREER